MELGDTFRNSVYDIFHFVAFLLLRQDISSFGLKKHWIYVPHFNAKCELTSVVNLRSDHSGGMLTPGLNSLKGRKHRLSSCPSDSCSCSDCPADDSLTLVPSMSQLLWPDLTRPRVKLICSLTNDNTIIFASFSAAPMNACVLNHTVIGVSHAENSHSPFIYEQF